MRTTGDEDHAARRGFAARYDGRIHDGDAPETEEPARPALLAAGLAAPLLLLVLAAAVLLGLPLPQRGSGRAASRPAPAIVIASTPAPSLPVLPAATPFVLRPPAPLI